MIRNRMEPPRNFMDYVTSPLSVAVVLSLQHTRLFVGGGCGLASGRAWDPGWAALQGVGIPLPPRGFAGPGVCPRMRAQMQPLRRAPMTPPNPHQPPPIIEPPGSTDPQTEPRRRHSMTPATGSLGDADGVI